ncbi:MAG: OmpA/MotB domain-containing protein, partial [Caulobacteraceae bacterium]
MSINRRIALLSGLSAAVAAPGAASADTVSYTYDALGRLRSATNSNGSTVTYDYDAAGNRTTMTSSGASAPTVTLTATPGAIASGGSSTLTWTSTNATSVSINQGVPTISPVSGGSVSVSPTATTVYNGRRRAYRYFDCDAGHHRNRRIIHSHVDEHERHERLDQSGRTRDLACLGRLGFRVSHCDNRLHDHRNRAGRHVDCASDGDRQPRAYGYFDGKPRQHRGGRIINSQLDERERHECLDQSRRAHDLARLRRLGFRVSHGDNRL